MLFAPLILVLLLYPRRHSSGKWKSQTVRLCFSFLEERVFLIRALPEMDLNSFFH